MERRGRYVKISQERWLGRLVLFADTNCRTGLQKVRNPLRRLLYPLRLSEWGQVQRCVEKMSDFDTFWSRYPRKVGKGTARKAWVKALTKATAEQIIAGLESQLYHLQAQYRGPGEDFRPHPSTWLNGERWDDEYDEPMTGHDMAVAALEEKWEREKRARIEGKVH